MISTRPRHRIPNHLWANPGTYVSSSYKAQRRRERRRLGISYRQQKRAMRAARRAQGKG